MTEKCKRELWGIYKKYQMQCSTEIDLLYKEMEDRAASMLSAGEMEEGENFGVPLSNGNILSLSFYGEGTEMSMYNGYDGTEEVLLGKDELDGRMERMILLNTSKTLKVSGDMIGRPYPDTFIDSLKKINPGEIVVFEEGKAYVCEKNEDMVLTLRPVYTGDLKRIDIHNFEPSQSFSLRLYDRNSVNRFYSANKKVLSESVEYSCYILKYAEQQREYMEKDIKNGTTTFDIGPVRLTARKSVLGKDVVWRDEKGAVLDRNSVNYLLAYLNTEPKEMDFVRERDTEDDKSLAMDEIEIRTIETLAKEGKFAQLAWNLEYYVMMNKNSLTVEINQYKDNGKHEFSARTLSTVYMDGETRFFLCGHLSNDLSGEMDGIEELSFKEVIEKLEEVYEHNREIIISKDMDLFLDKKILIDDRTSENIAKTVERMAADEERRNPVVSSGDTGTDFRDLLASYVKDEKQHIPVSRLMTRQDDGER